MQRPGQPPFQVLLDAHGAAVLRVATAIVGRDDAADVWQETFLRAWTAYPSFTASPSRSQASSVVPALGDAVLGARPWLLTIARNVAIDVLRARSKRPAPTGELVDLPVFMPEGYDADLWARVDALPPKQRLAVVYRYVADLAYADIAALLACSTDAARRSAHEGVRRLKREMTDGD